MKFGICFSQALGFNPSARDVIAFAREAEALGYHSILVGEHVAIPRHFDAGVYPAGVFEPRTPWYDSMVILAGIAGATSTIRVGTGIAVVPYQTPVQRAAAVATLDFISDGRCFFGAGVGWMREEFEELAIPFGDRGRRTDEYLEIMKRLWTGNSDPLRGEFIDFKGGSINPLPVQKPWPPILIGGETTAALRRIARHGDGFYINWKSLQEFRALLDELETHMAMAGRRGGELYMQLGATDIDYVRDAKADLLQYEQMGLDEIVFSPKCDTADEGMRTMRAFATEFISS